MIGQRLAQLRGTRTQQYVADQLGISRARYSHYENNYVQPDHAVLVRMADFYRVSVDYLLGRTDDRHGGIERQLLSELNSVPIDELISKYPLVYEGKQLDSEDKRAILSFIKTLRELKKD